MVSFPGVIIIEAILNNHGVVLDGELQDTLFEIADLKIAGRAWYIDCKNYSERTLDNFHVTPDDPAWRPKLNDNDFKHLAHRKLMAVQDVHGQQADCRLIFLNLASSDDWKRIYFDADFDEVRTFEDASIVVVPGVVQRENPGEYTDAFVSFFDHMYNAMS